MQSMVTSPLTYALVRPFWMDRERERKCVGVLMDFIFKFVRFFFPHPQIRGYCCCQNVNALFPEDCVYMCLHLPSPSWVLWVIWPQSVTNCMTSGLVAQLAYDLSVTLSFFLKFFLNYYFHPPAIFLFPLIEWADAGGDLLLCMRVDRRLDRPIRRLHLTFSLPASFLWCNKAAQKNKSIPSVSAHHIPLDMTDCVLLFKFVCIFWVCVLVLIYMEQSN